MFRRPTLFILGAGASEEAGFPIGSQLSDWISASLNYSMDTLGKLSGGSEEILRALSIQASQEGIIPGHYVQAARRITDGLIYSRSIDEFVNKHLDDKRLQFCAKIAILYRILLAERKSCVFIDPSNVFNGFKNPESISKSWYLEFVRILFDGLAKSNVRDVLKSVSVINFNYDRSLEHYIHRSLRDSYALSEQEATDALADINVIRPYGSLGHLPWQRNVGGGASFGHTATPHQLIAMTDRLRTFYEQKIDQTVQSRIAEFVSQAEQVVILGFGFHPQNIEILQPGKDTSTRAVYATAYQESDSAVENILGSIFQIFGNQTLNMSSRVYVHNKMKSADLMREYSRQLAR